MKDVFLHFDFGRSYRNDVDVRSQLLDRLPNTLFLIAGAVVVWLAIGLTVGMISAVKRGSFLDRFAMTAALVAISAPVYWLGLVVLYLFSDDIGRFPLLPGSGAFQAASNPFEKAEALIMPWFVLATAFAAIYARLLRANLLEVLGEDYIRTARAKGLSERRVIFHHGAALRADADRHRARPRHRHPRRRRDPHRERLQHPRHRAPHLRRDPARRHHHRAGRDALPGARRSASATCSSTSCTPSSTRG